MSMGAFGRGRVPIATLALLLGTGFASPRIASTSLKLDDLKRDQCRARKTVVGVQRKICPGNKWRPAVIVRRACCANAKGKAQSRRFPSRARPRMTSKGIQRTNRHTFNLFPPEYPRWRDGVAGGLFHRGPCLACASSLTKRNLEPVIVIARSATRP